MERLRLLQPTIAYNWRTGNGYAQEIELTNLSLQRNSTILSVVHDSTGAVLQVIDGARTTETHLALRYEYIMNFYRTGVSRWTPVVGVAISPYFRHYQEVPLVSLGFPTNEPRYGAMFFVVPRISYRISDRLHFDLNIPVRSSDGYYLTEVQSDPSLVRQRTNSINFESFRAFHSLRAGIGVML